MSDLPSKDSITPDFLEANDGKLVWIRDDYLSMRGYAVKETFDFLCHVADVKQQARREGRVFTA